MSILFEREDPAEKHRAEIIINPPEQQQGLGLMELGEADECAVDALGTRKRIISIY